MEIMKHGIGLRPEFREAAKRLGYEGAKALMRLYDYYGKDWIDWLASLYDPERGAFYYSNSARDSDGFLPDAESTMQTLSIIEYAEMLSDYNGSYYDAYPAVMRERLVEFIRKMQSPKDGYFYHEQWGEKIGSSRRGRDNSQCLQILRRFRSTPPYPTAEERLNKIAREGATEKDKESFAAHLLSREAMKAYLDKLDVNHESHSAGHILSSQALSIKAAGLADFVLDYIYERQSSETGLWEEGANYSSMSGLIKVSALISPLGGRLRYGDKAVKSAIDVILSDEDPEYITYVFNPLGALGTAMRGAAADAEDRGERREDMKLWEVVYSALPAMMDKTIEKLEKFRKPDGSFSYEQRRSAPTTQGVPVSLGVYEGDVNGLACAMHYTLGGVFGAIGIPKIPMCNGEDFEGFKKKIIAAHREFDKD